MNKLFFLFLMLLILSCSAQNTITIQTATDNITLNIEIADSSKEQMIGLMYRESLPENSGMLFIFPDEKQRVFWMKNTLILLDIIFIDKNGVIVDIKENVQPCTADPCEKYPSNAPAMYVLEVNAWFVKDNGVKIGDSLFLN